MPRTICTFVATRKVVARIVNVQGVTDAYRAKILCARFKAGIKVVFDVTNMACSMNLYGNADMVNLLRLLNRVGSGQ